MSAMKTFRVPFLKRVLLYETLSETEFAPAIGAGVFAPTCFVDITGYLEKKIAMMSRYESEMKKHPFPRSPESILALATLRGATAGVAAAEAFMVLREIV